MGKIFGNFLKELRLDRKMTLRDVEKQAKVSNAYLSQVERGERGTPTMKILVKLAEVYGIPVSTLSNKAEDELRCEKEQKSKTKGQKSEMPAPDTEFICRGYENLSEEKKKTLKNLLQWLKSEDKK